MATLLAVSPLNAAAGTRAPLGFTDADDVRLTGLNDVRWWPGISRQPTLNREGWNGDWQNGVFLAQAAVNVDLSTLKRAVPSAASLRWTGAPLTLYSGEAGQPWSEFETVFSGLVLNASIEDGSVRITAQVDSAPFEERVLTLTYDGRGGSGGVEDLKDKHKPAVFGEAENVEPILIDVVNNVFQVHGYGPIQGFRNLYERAVNFGPPIGDYPSYATLVAAAIPEGYWATCLAEGMFRLGAPPFGVITVDVSGDNTGGYHQTTAAVMLRLCEMAGVDPARIDAASMAAFEAAVPHPINLFLDTPDKLIDTLSLLALPCNAHVALSWVGKLQVTRFGGIPAPLLRLDVQGREKPPVLSASEQTVSAPWHRLELQYARCWRVMSRDEIMLEEDLVAAERTIWKQAPFMPETPVGDGVPAGWHSQKPEMSRPTLMPDGRLLFGPTWMSRAQQKGETTSDEGWSEPRLDDSRYKGFLIGGVKNSDLALGGADSIRVDGNGFADCRYIVEGIGGPFSLRFVVKDPETRFVAGVTFTDPAVTGSALSWTDIHTGVAVCPVAGHFGLDTPGVYPFTNKDLDNGLAVQAHARSHGAVPSFTEYALTSNGEVIDVFVNRELVRTYILNKDLVGDQVWPVFYLEGWDQSFGTDSDLFNIEWSLGTPGHVIGFPVVSSGGVLRRSRIEQGWETYAPFMPLMSDAAFIKAKSFTGGGRMAWRIDSSALGAGTSVLEMQVGTTHIGRFEFDNSGQWRAKRGGVTRKSGVWADGDMFGIGYFGKRVYFYRNGAQIDKKKVGRGQTVTPNITFATGARIYDLVVLPMNEEDYALNGSTIQTVFLTPFDDSSPLNPAGYTILGETADLNFAVQAHDEGDTDEIRVLARFSYNWSTSDPVGSATSYTPEALVEASFNGGAWETVPGTWTPDPGQAVTRGSGIGDMSFVPAEHLVAAGGGTVRVRLLAKNTVTGSYTIRPRTGSFVMAEWLT